MNEKIFTLKATLLVILVFTLASPLHAQAIDYYVDQNNASANDQNSGTMDRPWKTITKANLTLTAGNTLYIKAGTYTNQYIAPINSGTSSNPIIYRNFGTDTVTIQDATEGIYLSGKSHISITGIKFYNLDRFMVIANSSNYNIIAYCSFAQQRNRSDWVGSTIAGNSKYNWIHHCQFSKYGECRSGGGSGSDRGGVFDIGNEESGTDASTYNVIENCVLFHGGHHVLAVYSRYNTIRNNYFHNENWSLDHGHRNIIMGGNTVATGYTLFEGNRFGYSGNPCAFETTSNVKMTTSYNIFRYNSIYHSLAAGLELYSYYPQGNQYDLGSYNKIYNNTIFNSGYNIPSGYEGGSEDSAIWVGNSVPTGNQVKNNLYSANFKVHTGNTSPQTFANNWNGDAQGAPNFVNANTTPPSDKTDSTLPNLSLQSNSPAIDKAGPLTTVTSATGSGTSINVANASYFQDGAYGPAGVLQADWIAVGTVTNVVQISSISGNAITLANSISWTNGDPVWLYKKSDGLRVLYGTAPDAGAYEFFQAQAPSSPQNLRVIFP